MNCVTTFAVTPGHGQRIDPASDAMVLSHHGRHNSTVCRDLQAHRALLDEVPGYELLHARIANDVIEAMRVTARTVVR